MRRHPRLVCLSRPSGAVRGADRPRVLRLGRDLLAVSLDADGHVRPKIRGDKLRLPLHRPRGRLDLGRTGCGVPQAKYRKLDSRVLHCGGAGHHHRVACRDRTALDAVAALAIDLASLFAGIRGQPAASGWPLYFSSRVAPYCRPQVCGSLRVRAKAMRMPRSLLTVATLALVAAFARPAAGVPRFADTRPGAMPVDVELVLAVDVSYSMDPDEQALQREGYVTALRSKEFLQALREGANAKIAVTYIEWAGQFDQKVIVPWRLIEGPESADAVAAELAAAPYRRASRTSISGGLQLAKGLFDGSGYRGLRRVIDVSGDGANNAGLPVVQVRDEVLAAGITVNGLPLMLKRPNPGTMDIENLDVYYKDCVIGGRGAFVIPVRERSQFVEATRTKLVLEVAGREPPRRLLKASADRPRISCTIGEKMWQDRWGGYDFR